MVAADSTVSLPAIFLMMLLSNTVTHCSEEPSNTTLSSPHKSVCCTHSFMKKRRRKQTDGWSTLDYYVSNHPSRELSCLQRALTVKSILSSFQKHNVEIGDSVLKGRLKLPTLAVRMLPLRHSHCAYMTVYVCT